VNDREALFAAAERSGVQTEIEVRECV